MATRTWIGTTSGDWGVTTNWAESTVPVTGDAVVFRNNAVSVTAGLDQHTVTLASLSIDQTFTGTIGTSAAYLQVGATLCKIGNASQAPGAAASGSGRIKIDFGSVQTTVIVINTAGGSTDSGLAPVRLIGSHASNSITVMGGIVGIATTLDSETATVSVLTVTGATATVYCGPGVTLTTINQAAGTLSIGSAATTINQTGGVIATNGTGAITTFNAGGLAYPNSTGTITTLNIPGAGHADFSLDARSRTVTNCNIYKGGTLTTNNGRPLSITITPKLVFCGFEDVTLNMGFNFTATLS